MKIKEFLKSSFTDPEKPTYLFLSKPLFVIKSQYYAWRNPTFIFTNTSNVRENDVAGIVIEGSVYCPQNFMFRTSDAVPDQHEKQLLFDQENA